MAIESGSLLGGDFVATKSYPIEILPVGGTGDFKTLICPAGQRLKLTQVSGSTLLTSLTTITFGSRVVVNSVNLEVPGPTSLSGNNEYFIASGQNEITGEVGEDIIFSTNVSTSNNIEIMYQEGD